MGELDSSLEDLVCPISIQSKVINLGVVKGDYNLIMVAMAMVLHGMIDNFHSDNLAEICQRPGMKKLFFASFSRCNHALTCLSTSVVITTER